MLPALPPVEAKSLAVWLLSYFNDHLDTPVSTLLDLYPEWARVIEDAQAAERERCAKAVEEAVTCECRLRGCGFCECYGYGSFEQLAAQIRSGTGAGGAT
jgi:hypothetical protein